MIVLSWRDVVSLVSWSVLAGQPWLFSDLLLWLSCPTQHFTRLTVKLSGYNFAGRRRLPASLLWLASPDCPVTSILIVLMLPCNNIGTRACKQRYTCHQWKIKNALI
jgi:hypothetical protein